MNQFVWEHPMMRPALLVVALVAVGMAGCVTGEESDIAVASYPAFYLTDRIAGDQLSVLLLGRAGVDLHSYEPTLRDIDSLRKTDLLMLYGLGVEPWAERALRSLAANAPQHVEIARLPEGEDWLEPDHVHGHDDGHGHDDHDSDVDPHTWLDPLAYLESARAALEALVERWPQHRAGFEARFESLEAELLHLHESYRNGLAECTSDLIATNHNAYAYLARRYGFSVVSLHSVEPGAQPSAATVDRVIQTIRDLGLPVFFIEEGTDPRVVRAIEERTDVELRVLNTLEVPPPTGARGLLGYDDIMRQNLQHLQFALGCA